MASDFAGHGQEKTSLLKRQRCQQELYVAGILNIQGVFPPDTHFSMLLTIKI
jgi:hypothetical protein